MIHDAGSFTLRIQSDINMKRLHENMNKANLAAAEKGVL